MRTGSVLYVECRTCFVNGMVLRGDPQVGSGDLSVTSDGSDTILQNHDPDEVFNDLDSPVAGRRSPVAGQGFGVVACCLVHADLLRLVYTMLGTPACTIPPSPGRRAA